MRRARVGLVSGLGLVLLTSCILQSTTIETMTPEEARAATGCSSTAAPARAPVPTGTPFPNAPNVTRTCAPGNWVSTPLKVFHTDGTITVFPDGAQVTAAGIAGSGGRYSVNLLTRTPVSVVPLDDVVGIEAFRRSVDAPASVALTAIAVPVLAFATAGLMVAMFGSCPTIYAYEGGAEVLEAEAFSYSISPLLETRDVDRLGARVGPDGVLRLELRNEALETHYLNHIEVLEARHTAGKRAYPNQDGRVVSVGPAAAPLHAVDRDGTEWTEAVSERDDRAFASSEARIRAVTASDHWEHVELTFPRPEGESAGLVLRVRNSLLTSVLFYDMMLGSQGAGALDWLGQDLDRIGEAVELGRWFQETMGLRVSVLESDGWREVARVGDSGPIAWKDLAVVVPIPDTDEVRVRLTFLADEWRIDYAGLAGGVERAEVRRLPVASIGGIGEPPNEDYRRRLEEPDEAYLVTTAGTAAYLEFEPTPGVPADERTFFFSSQGYYTEWVRPEWIRSAPASEGSTGFEPSSETVVDLMGRWLERKEAYEAQFFATRIPVR